MPFLLHTGRFMILFLSLLLFLSQMMPAGNDKDQNLSDITELSLEELMNIKVNVGGRGEARTVMDSLVPVKVISGSDLLLSGELSTGEAIRSLLPSFNYYRTSVTDGTDHVAPSTLKGMGADQILLLLNGKRWHQSALLHLNGTIGRGTNSVDFDSIPLEAIERIEILPDDASAQYGSDAIAGIINIVLKRDFNSTISAYYRQSHENDGKLKATHVNLSAVGEEKYAIAIMAEYKNRGFTNRAGTDPRQQYFSDDPRNNDPAIKDRITHRFGEVQSDDFNLMLNGDWNIGDAIQLYTLASYSLRKGEAAGFFRRPLDRRNIIDVYPDGFLPLITPDVTNSAWLVGMKKDNIGGWRSDVSFSHAYHRFDFNVRNSLNTSFGTSSPKSFYSGSVIQMQTIFNADFFRSMDIGLYSKLDVGLGMEFRHEKYTQLAGEPASYENGGIPILAGPHKGEIAPVGAQVYPGYTPDNAVSANRTNFALYLDLESAISEYLRIGTAGRYERYSDFGNTYNGKISIRIKPIESFSIRTTAGTGFRAPSLSQSYFSATSSTFITERFYIVGTYSVNHPLSKALGATELKPEETVHFSIGSTFNLPSFVCQFSYFVIDVKDRIVISDNITSDPEIFGDDIPEILDLHNSSGARFITNAIDTLTRGYDLSLQYQFRLNRSASMRIFLEHHHNRTKLNGEIRLPSVFENAENPLIGANEIYRITEMQPKDVTHLGFKFLSPRITAQLRLLRYGPHYGEASSSGSRYYYTGKTLTNLNVTMKLNRILTIRLGANNLFNVYPDLKSDLDPGFLAAVFPYSSYSPFGFKGAIYYIKLSSRF